MLPCTKARTSPTLPPTAHEQHTIGLLAPEPVSPLLAVSAPLEAVPEVRHVELEAQVRLQVVSSAEGVVQYQQVIVVGEPAEREGIPVNSDHRCFSPVTSKSPNSPESAKRGSLSPIRLHAWPLRPQVKARRACAAACSSNL